MAQTFERNTKTINEICELIENGHLMVDESYQRRKVWMLPDKIRLIETILLDLIIPEVFFWNADVDALTGQTTTYIVDGQQRIDAVYEFVNDKFILNNRYLLDSSIKQLFGDMSFKNFDPESRKKIWSYSLSIVKLDDFNKESIKSMFYRLNLTNYALNDQEKRNSFNSKVKEKALLLAEIELWEKSKIFSASDIRRMKDVEYCTTIFILANEGIIDQVNSSKINAYYDDYKDNFDDDNVLLDKIIEAAQLIELLINDTTSSFIMRKAQMYTLFSLIFAFENEERTFPEEAIEIFDAFVFTYNLYKNGIDYNIIDTELRDLNETLKRYKLASSEGINKMTNRVTRHEVLYSICNGQSEIIIPNLMRLADLYQDALISLYEAKDTRTLQQSDELKAEEEAYK